jgi:hypothetical protein
MAPCLDSQARGIDLMGRPESLRPLSAPGPSAWNGGLSTMFLGGRALYPAHAGGSLCHDMTFHQLR